MNAHQIVANLLEDGVAAEYLDPSTKEFLSRADQIEREQLIAQEREAGQATEREMAEEEKIRREREAAARQKGTLLHGTRTRARDYFRSPERKTWPKMPEIERTGEVIPTDFGTKKQEPSVQIKGAQKYQPKHYIMPKPWKHWQ